jgi:hypothetical protein
MDGITSNGRFRLVTWFRSAVSVPRHPLRASRRQRHPLLVSCSGIAFVSSSPVTDDEHFSAPPFAWPPRSTDAVGYVSMRFPTVRWPWSSYDVLRSRNLCIPFRNFKNVYSEGATVNFSTLLYWRIVVVVVVVVVPPSVSSRNSIEQETPTTSHPTVPFLFFSFF